MSRLGQLLVAHGWITIQQLNRALQNQSSMAGRLGTCLLEMEAITEDNLLKGLSEQHGVPPVSLDDLKGIPDEVLTVIPDKIARRCRAVPFRVVGSRLDVAMMDPRNLAYQDEVAFASGKRVMVYVAHELRIMEALERYYREESPSRLALLADRLNRARYLWEREKPAGPPVPGPGDELLRLPSLPRAEPPKPSKPAKPPQWTPPPPSPKPAPARPAAAVAEAPVKRPAPRPVFQTVSLTAEERQELKADRDAQGRPEAPALPPAAVSGSLEEVDAALAGTHDREEVARLTLAFMVRSYRRAALFQVSKDKALAWMGQGEMDLPIFQKFSAGLDQPSLFLNLKQGSSLYIGPLPPMPVHRELARAWGGELPRECVMLPVRINDRLVAVLYADSGLKEGKKGIGGIELPELQRLAAAAGEALERCILHRKHAEAKR